MTKLTEYRKGKIKGAKREPLNLKQMCKCVLKFETGNDWHEIQLCQDWYFSKIKLDGGESIGSVAEVSLNNEMFKIFLNYYDNRVFISSVEYYAEKNKKNECYSLKEGTEILDIIFYSFDKNGWNTIDGIEYIEAKLLLSTKFNTTLYSENDPSKTLKISVI